MKAIFAGLTVAAMFAMYVSGVGIFISILAWLMTIMGLLETTLTFFTVLKFVGAWIVSLLAMSLFAVGVTQ